MCLQKLGGFLMKKRYILVLCICSIFAYVTPAHAASNSFLQNPPTLVNNVKYSDFVNKVNMLLETSVFHTSLSPLQYDPDLQKDGFASYFSFTPSRVMVGFFVKNDHVSFMIATLNVSNKKMMQDAMEVIGATCFVMGMTPDELKKLSDLKSQKENELLGRSYCAKSGKIVMLLINKDVELLSMSLLAQDL